MPSSLEDAPFWLQCLAAFNDLMGTTYTTMPEKCRHMLERPPRPSRSPKSAR